MPDDKVKSEANNNFKNPKLLELIKLELDREHVGNTKEKVLVFTIAVSGALTTRHRCSCALNGDTSEGESGCLASPR